MKVYCINFQGIAEGQRTNALVQGMFNMFRRLDPEKYIFLNSSVDKDYGPNIHGLSSKQLVVYNLFSKISARLNVPYYIRRTIQEKIVDFFLCKVLKKEQEPFLLITTMYAVRCTKYAKEKGYKVLFWAGNLNDNLYYETVKKEQKRLGLRYTDVYTSDYRISVYREMFKNIDFVYCLNPLSEWSFRDKRTILDSRKRKKVQVKCPKYFSTSIPDTIRIGYFGHTTLLKGVHLLGEALALCKYKDKIELILAGSVDHYVKGILDKSDAQITYLGPVPEEKKWTTIQSFDYMIVPSLYDAGPGTIMEAYMCDVPVIVSDGCGDVVRVKDDPKCIVFKTMDIDDLAGKIDYAYENRAQYFQPSAKDEEYNDTTMSTGNLDFFINMIEEL